MNECNFHMLSLPFRFYILLRNNLGLSKTGVPVLFVSFVIIQIEISLINFFSVLFEIGQNPFLILIGALVKENGFVFIVN